MVALVRSALNEDIGSGDVTSLACLMPEPIHAEVVAKSAGVLSGAEPFLVAFKLVDPASQIEFGKFDGNRFEPGDVIARVSGFNQTVMTAERTALNFLGHLSGIATLTRAFVDRLAGLNCRLLDTRKTTPGFRLMEKRAVEHGGGVNHRLGLYDMILIKDNHIAAAGSITKAVEYSLEYLDSPDCRRQFGKDGCTFDMEVEVTSEDQLREAIGLGVKRIMLDNQSTSSLAALVTLARELDREVKLEASGNITLDNVAEIGATGVDYISTGLITHSAPNADFSLRISDKKI
jgi:nicotinate-nucleotide pyrophosphorylase (carboxylating)